MQLYKFSDKGPRPTNQDSFFLEYLHSGQLLAAVADGVGGNKGGETASKLAISELTSCSNQGKSLIEGLEQAHRTILEAASSEPELNGMATTLTAVAYQNGTITGVHCGDSRIYILRNKGIKQLTNDHTEVARLLAEGRLTKENAINYPRKNILDSALGTHKALIKQEFTFEMKPGDRLIAITDGIYENLTKKDIVKLSLNSYSLEEFCKKIIDRVIDCEPSDNFTLVGFEIDQ